MNDNLFKNVEAKTNVKKEDILKLASMVQSEDLSNEQNLRSLIKSVASLANKDVSKEKEDKLVKLISNPNNINNFKKNI